MRAMTLSTLPEYIKKNILENEVWQDHIVLLGEMGSNAKTFSVSFGKKGITAPVVFPREFFKSKSIDGFMQGRLLPFQIIKKEAITPKVLELLEKSELVIYE